MYQLILIDGLGDKKARIRSDATRMSTKGIRGRTRFGMFFDERQRSSVRSQRGGKQKVVEVV